MGSNTDYIELTNQPTACGWQLTQLRVIEIFLKEFGVEIED